MNNNTVAALVIGAIVLLGGAALFMYGSSDATPTTTNETTTGLPAGTSGTDAGTYSSTTTTTTTPAPPLGASKAATVVTGSTATLNGLVTANGAPTTYWFEYSVDPLASAATSRSTGRLVIPASATQAPVYVAVTGLTAQTTYYFRIVTENSSGLVKGERLSFTTK